MERKDFHIVLISPFGLDVGVYALSSFVKSRGYTSYNVEFNRLTIPLESTDNNDYFTAQEFKRDLFPEKDLQLLLDLLTQLKPSLIGISVSSMCFRTAAWLAREIKKYFDIPIVWGGIHATISPEDCIEHADIVCTGEGEYPLYEIAEKIRNKQPVKEIKNTWIRIGNKIEKNPMRELIKDLDSLPYIDRSNGENNFFIERGKIINNPIIKAGHHINGYPIIVSRGCMYNCSFCFNPIVRERYKGLGPYLRNRSVDHVMSELKCAVHNSNISLVRFWDNIFTYDEKWIDEFCRHYPYEVARPFMCYIHPQHIKYSVLEKLSKVGLNIVSIGIQSGSEHTNRRVFNRQQSNGRIMRLARFTKSLQITSLYEVIADNCFENDQDHYYTSELLMNLPRPNKVCLFSLAFFPKTPLTNKALREEVIKEREVEHHTPKSIDNLFLFIPKSRDANQMFWNCIKAMSFNPHFPRFIVRRCRKSKLFRKKPFLLFSLCRLWLMLFKQRGKVKDTSCLMPTLNENSFNNDHVIWPGNKNIYLKNVSIFNLFPMGKNNGRYSFCFRINYPAQHSLSIDGFQIELIRLREIHLSKKNIWRLKFPMALAGHKEIKFDLELPDIYCYMDTHRMKMTQIKRKIDAFGEETLCIMKAKIIKRGNYLPFKLNTFLCAWSLCFVKGKTHEDARLSHEERY